MINIALLCFGKDVNYYHMNILLWNLFSFVLLLDLPNVIRITSPWVMIPLQIFELMRVLLQFVSRSLIVI